MGENSAGLIALIRSNKMILTEGAVVERLRREFGVEPDEFLVYGGAIYNKRSRNLLKNIYREYIDIAVQYKLPIMIMASTRRANKERIEASAFNHLNVNDDFIEFLYALRLEYKDYKESIFIGGIIGTRGDAYNAGKALEEEVAYRFHKHQCSLFKHSKADFIFAGVIPSVSEAKGLARAMEETGLPYIVSFVVNKKGQLLDETLISDAIEKIDEKYNPICYMVNCVHPKNLLLGLNLERNKTLIVKTRLKGIQANASALSPEELNNSTLLKEESFDELIKGLNELRTTFGFNILGGCCGTNKRHIEYIAMKDYNK